MGGKLHWLKMENHHKPAPDGSTYRSDHRVSLQTRNPSW